MPTSGVVQYSAAGCAVRRSGTRGGASVAFAAALASTSYPAWAKIGFGLGCVIAWADVVVQYVERRRTEGRADPLPVATPATVPMLHRFLGIGLLTVAAALLLLKYFGIAPGLRADSRREVDCVLSLRNRRRARGGGAYRLQAIAPIIDQRIARG